jgi:hypothetical protein
VSEPRFAALAADLEVEIGELVRLEPELARLAPRLEREHDTLDLRAAGSILHDFYSGVERIFERIAVEIDGGAPGGHDWHVALLRRMSVSIDTVRPAVISPETAATLDEYLRFRHVFRNVYGRQLRWERLEPLVNGLATTAGQTFDEIRGFAAWLRRLAAEA